MDARIIGVGRALGMDIGHEVYVLVRIVISTGSHSRAWNYHLGVFGK